MLIFNALYKKSDLLYLMRFYSKCTSHVIYIRLNFIRKYSRKLSMNFKNSNQFHMFAIEINSAPFKSKNHCLWNKFKFLFGCSTNRNDISHEISSHRPLFRKFYALVWSELLFSRFYNRQGHPSNIRWRRGVKM